MMDQLSREANKASLVLIMLMNHAEIIIIVKGHTVCLAGQVNFEECFISGKFAGLPVMKTV